MLNGAVFYIMQGLDSKLKPVGEKRAYLLNGKRNMILVPPYAAHVLLVKKGTSLIGYYSKSPLQGKTVEYDLKIPTTAVPLILKMMQNYTDEEQKKIEKLLAVRIVFP